VEKLSVGSMITWLGLLIRFPSVLGRMLFIAMEYLYYRFRITELFDMVIYGPPFEAYIKYFPLHLATRNQKNLQVPDSAELSSAKKTQIPSVFAKSYPAHLR